MSEFDSASATTSDQGGNPDQLLNSLESQYASEADLSDTIQVDDDGNETQVDPEEATKFTINKYDHAKGEQVPTEISLAKIRSVLQIPQDVKLDVSDPSVSKWLARVTQGVYNMNAKAISAGKVHSDLSRERQEKEQGINMFKQAPQQAVPMLLQSLGYNGDQIEAVLEDILAGFYEKKGLLAPDPAKQQQQRPQYDPREEQMRQKEEELAQREVQQLAIQYEPAIESKISSAITNAGYQADPELISTVAEEILRNRIAGNPIGPKAAIENLNKRMSLLSKNNPSAAAKNIPASVTRQATKNQIQNLKQNGTQVRLPNGQPAQQQKQITNPDDYLTSVVNRIKSQGG